MKILFHMINLSFVMLRTTVTKKKHTNQCDRIKNVFFSAIIYGVRGWMSTKLKWKKNRQIVRPLRIFFFVPKSVNFFFSFFARGIESTKLFFKYFILSIWLCLWWLWIACLRCVFFPNLVVVHIQIKFFGSHYYIALRCLTWWRSIERIVKQKRLQKKTLYDEITICAEKKARE